MRRRDHSETWHGRTRDGTLSYKILMEPGRMQSGTLATQRRLPVTGFARIVTPSSHAAEACETLAETATSH